MAARTRETQQIFLKFDGRSRISSNECIVVKIYKLVIKSYSFTCKETLAEVTNSWFQGMATRKCCFGKSGQYDIKSGKSVGKQCKLTITLMVGWVSSIKYRENDFGTIS